MAIIPSDAFPGKIDTSDPTNYPLGKARDVTASGDGTGTPWRALWLNEPFGFFQALLTHSGVSASGDPETVTASQYLEALQKIGDRLILTPGDTTANIPTWVKRIKVTVVGAGGGGSGASATGNGSSTEARGPGGGGGALVVGWINNPDASYSVSVGVGGAGGEAGGGVAEPGGGTAGTEGDPSDFGGLIVAGGGKGGTQPEGGTGPYNYGTGGFGGAPVTVPSGGLSTFGGAGQDGSSSVNSGAINKSAAQGGFQNFGGQGGPGGTVGISANPVDGEAGQDGIIIVEWGVGL